MTTLRYPSSYFDAPDERHCPHCSRCCDEVGHCCDEDCVPYWEKHSDTPEPDAHCACDCDRCRLPWASVCDESAEHKACNRHRED